MRKIGLVLLVSSIFVLDAYQTASQSETVLPYQSASQTDTILVESGKVRDEGGVIIDKTKPTQIARHHLFSRCTGDTVHMPGSHYCGGIAKDPKGGTICKGVCTSKDKDERRG